MKKEAISAFRQVRDDIQKNESIVLVITAIVSTVVAIGLLNVGSMQYSIASQQLALSQGQLELGNKQLELSNHQLNLSDRQSDIVEKQLDLNNRQFELDAMGLRPWVQVDNSNFPFISLKNVGTLPARVDTYAVTCDYDGKQGSAYAITDAITMFPGEESSQFYVRKSAASCGTASMLESYFMDISYSSPGAADKGVYETRVRIDRHLEADAKALEYIEVT
jgi:hypothetical protein